MIKSPPATSTPIFSYSHLLENISYTLGDSFMYFWVNENLFQQHSSLSNDLFLIYLLTAAPFNGKSISRVQLLPG